MVPITEIVPLFFVGNANSNLSFNDPGDIFPTILAPPNDKSDRLHGTPNPSCDCMLASAKWVVFRTHISKSAGARTNLRRSRPL